MVNKSTILNNSEKDFLRQSCIEGSRFYNHYLANKDFLIITDTLTLYEITFKTRDFIHFTGLHVNVSDNKFYDLCVKGNLARNNIRDNQKYNYRTLKDKAISVRKLNKFLHADISTNLFISNLSTHTKLFPVAITNDKENMTLAFIGNHLHARSLRKAKQSTNYESANRIVCILLKDTNSELYSQIIYLKNIKKLSKVIKENKNLISPFVRSIVSSSF